MFKIKNDIELGLRLQNITCERQGINLLSIVRSSRRISEIMPLLPRLLESFHPKLSPFQDATNVFRNGSDTVCSYTREHN